MLFSEDDQGVIEQVLRARRDVRGNRFTDQDLSDSDLDKILAAATTAPSVGYSQPWEFVVIRDPSIKAAVAKSFELENLSAQAQFENDKARQYAQLKLEGITETPVNIAVFYTPSDKPVLGQTSMPDMGEYSVVCAVQNMWLMARAMNIGIGWVSIINPEQVKNILSAPKQNKLVAYLCVGHVDQFLEKPELETLKWEPAKVLSSLVRYDKY